MDDHAKSEPEAKQAAAPDAGSGARDLSFLWPLIDRIRAVEFKFQGDGPAQPTADLEARLTTLENEVAAIRRTLQEAAGQEAASQEAAGASADGGRAATPTVTEAVELQPQSWRRAAFGSATAVVLLLVAHYLAVFAFDLPAVILRLASIAIPLPIGIWMTLHRRIRPWLETSMAVSVGLIAVGAMSYVVSVHDATPFLPQSGGEWRETAEYVASIAFAYATGVLISAALQARSGAPNRAGQLTLKLAQAITAVTGKAITTGPQIKKHVDLIQALLNAAVLLTSAVMAVVTGLRSVIR
jgi:hypothetical protein